MVDGSRLLGLLARGRALGPSKVFIFALLAWALCRSLERQRTRDDIVAGMAGGIAVLFYSAAPVVVPILLLFSSGYRVFSRAGARRFLVAMALPAAAMVAVVGKNGLQFDLWSTGSMGGQNMVKSVIIAG